MSDTPKQSPLGVNALGSFLNNQGLNINAATTNFIGSSKDNSTYTPGNLINNTCLSLLTYAINDAFTRGVPNGGTTVANTTYNNLISIGSTTIPGLGNSVPPTYEIDDPSGAWSGEATTGYGISGTTGQGQDATWLPYDTTNTNSSVTQWGYLRLIALQAWNAFNWNGSSVTAATPDYKEFTTSFQTVQGFKSYINKTILAMNNSKTFLQGTYSNMNDLITSDVSGVTLSTQVFGQDLINLGKALNLQRISVFGLPSALLQILNENSAITQDLSLALLSSGLSLTDVENILNGKPASKQQEQFIYGAFLIIRGAGLADILKPLLCKTAGLESLADLLNVKKIFPLSYASLTVPVYNSAPSINNSKTYYLLYTNNGVNPQLSNPAIKEQIGTLLVPGMTLTESI